MTTYIGDDILDSLDRTKPVTGGANRDPFIGEGRHRLMVLDLKPFVDKDYGTVIRATFEVRETTNPKVHPVGSRTTKMWYIQKPPLKSYYTSDKDRFADFIRKLKGAPEGSPIGQSVAALIRDRVAEQLARGMVIDAFGLETSKKADGSPALDKNGQPKKQYVDVSWTTVAQDPTGIAQMRMKAEASLAQRSTGPNDTAQAAPPVAQYAAAPPPTMPYTPPVAQYAAAPPPTMPYTPPVAAPAPTTSLLAQLPQDPNGKIGW